MPTATAQLYLNYKLKSVAHLPWRQMTYKFLNTIVDDLGAFVIKMPTLHRYPARRQNRGRHMPGTWHGTPHAWPGRLWAGSSSVMSSVVHADPARLTGGTFLLAGRSPAMLRFRRLAVFRDDLIFLIFLYQRYIYPIDKQRPNEFGCAHCCLYAQVNYTSSSLTS